MNQHNAFHPAKTQRVKLLISFCLLAFHGFSITDPTRIFTNLPIKDTKALIDTCYVSIGPSLTICAGESAQLTATHSGGTLLWSTGEQANTITVTPSFTTTYAVTLTDNGCEASDMVTVTVVPTPAIALPDEQVICPGESVLIGPSTVDPGASYLWSPGGFFGPSISVSPTETTVYTLIAFSPFGCVVSASTKVTVFGPGWISFNQPNPVLCRGDRAFLSLAPIDPALYPNIKFHWSPDGVTPSGFYNLFVAPKETTVYTFTATIPGCSVSDSTTVTVYPPDVNTGLSGECAFTGLSNLQMQQPVLDGSILAMNGVGYDISFNEANTCHFNGSSSRIDLGADNRGVSDAVSLVVWINTTDTIHSQWIAGKYSAAADHGYALQIGDNANGHIGKVAFGGGDGTGIYHSSGFGFSPYLVNDGQWHCVVGTAGDNNWTVFVDAVKTSSATGSTTNGILLNADPEPFTIGWHNSPDTPLWYKGDMDEVRIYNRVLTYCEIDSVCAHRNISGTVGIPSKPDFMLYPNPNAGNFTVRLNEPAKAGMTLRITDLTGRLMMTQHVVPADTEQFIQTAGLPNGLYFLQLGLEEHVIGTVRFVKQ